MRNPKMVTGDLEILSKKALIVGEEPSICELVSLLLGDLGFEPMHISQANWLPKTTVHANPELIILDLSHGKMMSPFRNLSEMRGHASMKNMKIMLLGGPDVKKDMDASVGDAKLHFCLTPFSPTRFRYEIYQLYELEN